MCRKSIQTGKDICGREQAVRPRMHKKWQVRQRIKELER